MYIKLKKIIILLFIILGYSLIFLPNKIFASSTDYTIKSYNVDIIVNKNNSFDITETITANFSKEKHGIVRKIPTSNTVIRNDGTIVNNIAFITKVELSEQYSRSSDSTYSIFTIGDKEKTLLGEHTYIIKYRYNLFGKDGLENADEFYFNIIGTGWDTSIENATFRITMPKEFDSSLLGFSSGDKGSKDSSNVEYSVDGKIITGNIKKPLNSFQGVTIRLTLPEEYFFNILYFIEKIYPKIIIIIGVIFLLKAYRVWLNYGKDDEIIETVEFYPPEGFNSAEIGYIYYGKATNEAIISILIQLANKGYINIEEIEEEDNTIKSTFKIRKLKEYDGQDAIESVFFSGLFENGTPNTEEFEQQIKELEEKGEKVTKSKISSIKKKLTVRVVKEEELKNRFYLTINRIKWYLDDKIGKKIYEKTDIKQRKIKIMIYLLCFLTLCGILVQSKVETIFRLLSIGVLQFSLTRIINIVFFYRKKTVGNIISIAINTVISTFFIITFIYSLALQKREVGIYYIIMFSIIIFLGILAVLMSKRTKNASKLLGKIKGFKNFLENAEKNQLEALIEENPEYFYDILPYTYALGVSKKWVEKFETIATILPDWFAYSSFDTFDKKYKRVSDSMTYGAKMDEVQTSIRDFFSSSPSSDSYSSSSSNRDSSGGGSSGGGSGGRRRKFVVKTICYL